MSFRTLVFSPFLVGLFVSGAHADWNYVKWGMTAEQAISASKGEARASGGDGGKKIVCIFDDQKPLAFIPEKKIGAFTFDVIICGDARRRVTSVALRPVPDQGNYNALRAELLGRYGKPIQDGGGDMAITVWRDTKSQNLVRLSRVINGGSIEYRAIASGL
jgi:hypothetical protein